MVQCATCDRQIGPGRGGRRVVNGKWYCTDCGLEAMERRRERIIAYLWRDGPPEVYFAAPAAGKDLDFPKGPRRQTGVLALTDKGVVYAQHGEYFATNGPAWPAIFSIFLPGPFFYTVPVDKTEKRHYERAIQPVLAANEMNAVSMIESAGQVFLWGPDVLRKVRLGLSRCRLSWKGGQAVYQWVCDPREIRSRLGVCRAFSNAIQQGRSVAEDCREAIRLAQMDV